MDPLRWTILGIGVVILAAVYAYGRWQERRERERTRTSFEEEAPAAPSRDARAREPVVDELDDDVPDSGPAPFDAVGDPVDDVPERRRPAAYDQPFGDDEALEAIDRLIARHEARREPRETDETREETERPWWEMPAAEASESAEAGERPKAPDTPAAQEEPEPLPLDFGPEPEPEPEREAEPEAEREPEPEPPARRGPPASSQATGQPAPLELPPASRVEVDAFRRGHMEDAEKIIVLYVRASEGQRFPGDAVRRALQAVNMVPGEHRIWHRRGRSAVGRFNVFSVASLVEPGYLDPDEMDDIETPGLAFFMQLPLPVDGDEALDALFAASYRIAQDLGGELQDEHRSTLTRQAAERLREELREHRRQLNLAAHRDS